VFPFFRKALYEKRKGDGVPSTKEGFWGMGEKGRWGRASLVKGGRPSGGKKRGEGLPPSYQREEGSSRKKGG